MTKKKIAVIGSEACGLSSLKCCLDEDLKSVCFERTDDIGGLCRYQTTVYSVKKRPNFSSSGQWEVVTECEGKKKVNVFDGVMHCTGHHTNANLSLESFPGIEKFKGQYFHRQDYKNPEALAGKRVFIIVGNSGGDLAVEISYTAKQVFLSTRSGAWILIHVGDHGYPFDVVHFSQLKHLISKICGQALTNTFFDKSMSQRFDYKMFGLMPKHRYVLRMGMELITAKIQEQGLFPQANRAISIHTIRKSREFEIQFLPYQPHKNKIC
ncbi:Dimethylaniline monooxygenase [N-oxide-forming] 5 [Sciurus carolinensis]|uniref:Flavin-containing monooxygenase n=1 Tax=Sciurus carolinensis TaxID=30640 RepID=A0AA41NHJ2_SCICA|nr:Dimethylaniline monooxygenase [N-oxide-forming] 5 [Sciurus carolinensis]